MRRTLPAGSSPTSGVFRAALALLAAVSVLPIAAAPSFASATAILVQTGTYHHEWQVQALAGAAGEPARQRVVSSVAEMLHTEGAYAGTIEYHDVLGVGAAPNVTSQEAVFSLDLEGAPVPGGDTIGGTFTGTVALTIRPAADVDAAVADAMLDVEGTETVYDVAGHWGAELAGTTARGELVFENAIPQGGAGGPADGPAYFNRAVADAASELGGGQLFAAEAEEIAPTENTGPADGTPPEGGSDADDTGSGSSSPGIFDYIRKGLDGGDLPSGLPIPTDLAAAARALFDARPIGATALPDNAVGIDVHVAGAYLDAKNRAALLLAEDGPTPQDATAATAQAQEMRDAVPGVPAVPADEMAAVAWRDLATNALASVRDARGADALARQLALVGPQSGPDVAVAARTWFHVATAVGSARPFGSLAQAAAAVAADVAAAPLEPGPLSDAVLAAADAPGAPSSALEVGRFDAEPSLDATASPDGATLPSAALATSGTRSGDLLGLQYATSGGMQMAAPATWLAHRRGDGALYWLAGEGADVALADGSLLGWGHELRRAALVDALRCGRWLAVYPTE